jgi:hypothetical protein
MPSDQQSRFARVRGANGGEWVDRATLPSEQAAEKQPGTDAGKQPVQATVTADGKGLVLGEMTLSETDIRQLMTEAGAREARKTTMPVTAADYRLDLPAEMPEGTKFTWSIDHPVLGPIIGQAKEFAFANNIEQNGFQKMMNLYVAAQVQEAQTISKAQAAEVAKLGPMAAHRVDAVTTFVRGMVGDDKLAQAITRQLFTADQITGFERLIRRVTNGGAASFRQDGREPHNPNTGPLSSMSEAEYASLSAAEKYSIAKNGR